jgi:hypothetical protein
MEPRVGFGLTTFALPRQRSNRLSYRGSTETNLTPFLIVEGNKRRCESCGDHTTSLLISTERRLSGCRGSTAWPIAPGTLLWA